MYRHYNLKQDLLRIMLKFVSGAHMYETENSHVQTNVAMQVLE